MLFRSPAGTHDGNPATKDQISVTAITKQIAGALLVHYTFDQCLPNLSVAFVRYLISAVGTGTALDLSQCTAQMDDSTQSEGLAFNGTITTTLAEAYLDMPTNGSSTYISPTKWTPALVNSQDWLIEMAAVAMTGNTTTISITEARLEIWGWPFLRSA